MNRRDLLVLSAALIGAPAAAVAQAASGAAQLAAVPLLPSPVLPQRRLPDLKVIAGLRPYRNGSYRLETEAIGEKYVVHNYGHGGGGITMSWGCAARVRDLVAAWPGAAAGLKVAVLGAGVMGMTAATLLHEAGFQVTIYADKFTPHTTSDIAGGQWGPSFVAHSDKADFEGLLKTAYGMHLARGARYGVSQRDNYTLGTADELAYAQMAGAAPPEILAKLPFAEVTHGGMRYPTLLVEPPVLLPRLHADLRAAGVAFNTRKLSSPAEIDALAEPVVVNCMGLGSRDVWPDLALRGIRGQLALLPPQPKLTYLFSGLGYMFPRRDHLVIGGSFTRLQPGDEDATPDPDMAWMMIRVMNAVFQGLLPLPEWLTGRDQALS